ncbi:M14-type cytosolic carboxypeptidase [Myxococcota bacterium]|nr:M14-type cytosolic carboxypeptidase [Myxococcota bacterium]
MPITVSAAFDAGNIEQLAAPSAPGPDGLVTLRLRIRPDADPAHYQWFFFRVQGARGVPLLLRLENAAGASYPDAWEGTRAVVSVDRQDWLRADTTYRDGQLEIRHQAQADACWFAYFAPYSLERHHDLVARCVAGGLARHDVLGHSLDGRDLDRLVVGQGPRVLWIIGRQHPGESMASFWMEGFLGRLLDPDDALARQVRAAATVHVVPHMNPDGATRGHLRTNAAGANLNREWQEPTAARSPEVLCVRDAMDATGVDLCLDVHGDEKLPYNFLSGAEGIPGFTPRLAALQDRFAAAYQRANPDLQRVHGYAVDPPGQALMTMCTNQVAQRFDCLAYTLEMPFKDNADAPDPVRGWSPARCARLGASAVDAVADVLPTLR